jgi:fused signal recognition particle receptor
VSLFARWQSGLRRTAAQWAARLDALWRQDSATPPTSPLEGETLEALEAALLGCDVGVEATRRLLDAVRQRRGAGSPREVLKAEIRAIFAAAARPGADGPPPRVVLVVGVNGTGKTTTVGKLAHLATRRGERVLVCAADTFRAAALEQLAVWAARAGAALIRAHPGADPAAVVFDALQAAQARRVDWVLVDTAGRLHTRTNLMAELDKIRRVAARAVPGAPHEVLLVLDATVGQNGLVQAAEFLRAAGTTGVVLTKLDGTAKGGVAVAVAEQLKLPIRYVGVGEGIDDLLPFSVDAYLAALFDEVA